MREGSFTMRIFLTGATGFIGSRILRRLSERAHQVTCLVRPRGKREIDARALPGVSTLAGEFTQPESWLDTVSNHDVVINAVGIIRETASAGFDAVHTHAPITLFEAAAKAGIRKVIQISALGADAEAQSSYHLSKRAADQRLTELGVAHVILRPSFVYGPQDQSMTFFLSLAALPLTPVPGDGKYRVQPIHIDDLVRAVVDAVERDELQNVIVDVAGATPLTFDELLDHLARRIGKKQACKLHVPWGVMETVAAITDALGGHGPITRDELGMLHRGNTCDLAHLRKVFGFEPVSFAVGIQRKPLTQADRWYATLTHVRLPLRLSVAFIWIATGIVSAFFSVETGFALLRQIGITGALANLCLYGTSYLEIAIGLLTAIGWHVRWMGVIQLLLMAGFMAILSFGMPDLWLHPFGPLTKNIPIIGATLAMMALEE